MEWAAAGARPLRSPGEPDRVPIAGFWTCLLRLERSYFFLGHAGRSSAYPPPFASPFDPPRAPPFGGSHEGRDCTTSMREKRRRRPPVSASKEQ